MKIVTLTFISVFLVHPARVWSSIQIKLNLSVWEYTFAPREYLHQHLETRFSRALAGMVMYSPETSEIAKGNNQFKKK